MPDDNARKIDSRLRRYAEDGGVSLEPHDTPYIRRLGARLFGPMSADAADNASKEDLYAPVFIEVANTVHDEMGETAARCGVEASACRVSAYSDALKL